MKPYHKIQTVYKRNPETNFKTLLEDEYSLPEFEYLANNKWSFAEKVNGINIKAMFDGEHISFSGKTDNAQIPSPLVKRLNEHFLPQVEVFKELFLEGVCLYGEGYGAGVRKGSGIYRQDQDFVLFDVKIGDWWLQRNDIEDIAQKLGLDIVPIIGSGTLKNMVEMAAVGFNSTWGDFQAEGIVARPSIELKARNGRRIITKIKCKDFE